MVLGTFELGQTVATKGVMGLLEETEIYEILSRHATSDWGDLCHDDKELNDTALKTGRGRLFSSYNTTKGKVWIITEHDRTVTTVLLPDEY